MNLYEQIMLWLKDYEPLSSEWIYFNVSNYEAGLISLNSVSNSRYLKKDVVGNRTVELTFAIDMMKDYDEGTSDTNLIALQEVNNFADWIETAGHPDFGNKEIQMVEVLSNVPSLAVDRNANIVKYQFQVKITYVEREEK